MNDADKHMTNHSDEELMALVTERNSHALKTLYDRHGKSLYNFILRYTNNKELSEELLQEAFTKAWFASHTFNPGKGTFKAWIFAIGINLTRNEMEKKHHSYQHVEFEEEAGHGVRGPEIAEHSLEHSDMKETIAQALAQLSPLLREIIILKHYQKLKFSEIARMTNTPEGTLKARMHNAVIRLRSILYDMEI